MPQVTTYTFPPGNNRDVCALQSLNGAGLLILNGNLANPITHEVSFISRGYNRQVSITSVSNLSTATFLIAGISNGVVIDEIIAGPNNSTVYSNLTYDVITSIGVDEAVAAVSVGTGWKGFFTLINVNLYAKNPYWNLSIAQLAQTGVNQLNNFEIRGCATNIYNNGYSIQDNYTNNWNTFVLESLIDVQQGKVTDSTPWVQFLVQVGKNPTTVGYGAMLNFSQYQ